MTHPQRYINITRKGDMSRYIEGLKVIHIFLRKNINVTMLAPVGEMPVARNV